MLSCFIVFMSHNRPDFIHHQKKSVNVSIIREAVFGLQDGMVSTFGAITGIAAATNDQFTVILAGAVIIAVESISMGVGSFMSSKSEKEIDERKIHEEKIELLENPEAEKIELEGMFIDDGWPKKLAKSMALEASKNKDLFLKEMAYRELKLIPDNATSPGKNGIAMLFSYIIGGFVPLTVYFILPIKSAIPISIFVTLIGLFLVGVWTTTFSKRKWWRAGFEMLLLAGIAGFVGYYIGQLVDKIIK